MRFNIIVVVSAFLVSSCANMYMKPLNAKKRETSRVIKAKKSKKQSFDSALVFLSKSVKNSNHAIKLKDREGGKIVAKINYTCIGLKRPDVVTPISETDVTYTVEVGFKPKKMRVIVVAESFMKGLGLNAYEQFIAQDKGQNEAVQKCNNELIDAIVAGVKTESKKDDW